jgi:hypothetical protein
LLAAPQAPMSTPWTDVLDKACVWASGQTTATNAATKIAESLYECGFKYETDEGASNYYVYYMQFDLEQIISDLGNPTGIEVNCLDMAMAVVTFGNALGSGSNLTTFTGNVVEGFPTYPYERNWFFLNYIDPIGSASPTNNTFSSPLIGNDCRYGGFAWHAFAENNNNSVWDATLQYDIDTDPDNVSGSNPGCGNATTGHTWKLPCNETESTYIERLVDPWTDKTNCIGEDCGWFDDEEFTIYIEN